MLKLKYLSEPKAIQSMKFTKRGHTYQPKGNTEWKSWIKLQTIQQLPEYFEMITTAVEIVKCHFVFSPLKSFSKKKLKMINQGFTIYKISRPDLQDNLIKGLIDSLSGIVFKDDSQIVKVNNTAKYYGLQAMIILELQEVTT